MAGIRPFQPEDLDEVLPIEQGAFSHPWSAGMFMGELLRGDTARCFVVEVPAVNVQRGAVIAGFLMSTLVVDELFITNLAVGSRFRKKGLARDLVAHALECAVMEGARWCQLEVRPSNTGARALYAKFGFRRIGVRKRYYHDGEDALVLGLDLTDRDPDRGRAQPDKIRTRGPA